MLHRLLLASASAVAIAGSAFAADLPSRAPPPVYVPPTPIFTWTGVYIGGQVGYAWGTQKANVAVPQVTNGAGAVVGVGGTAFNSYSAEGVIGGAHVGYNYQVNQWVLGIEGSVDGTSISKTFIPGTDFYPGVALLNNFGLTYSTSIPIEGSIRGRLGVAWDRVLLYATGGVAFAGVNATVNSPFGSVTASTTRVGWTVGGGLEYAVTNNWSVYAEYRYSDFGSNSNNLGRAFDFTPVRLTAQAAIVNRHFTQNQVQVGFSYRFSPPPAPIVAKY
jgi:outer membrane immunogenic protein